MLLDSACLLLWRPARFSTLCPQFLESLPAMRHHQRRVEPKPNNFHPASSSLRAFGQQLEIDSKQSSSALECHKYYPRSLEIPCSIRRSTRLVCSAASSRPKHPGGAHAGFYTWVGFNCASSGCAVGPHGHGEDVYWMGPWRATSYPYGACIELIKSPSSTHLHGNQGSQSSIPDVPHMFL